MTTLDYWFIFLLIVWKAVIWGIASLANFLEDKKPVAGTFSGLASFGMAMLAVNFWGIMP